MEKRKIIIDTDPGIDDAVALAIALFEESLDVQLITTVAGNVGLEQVTYNVMRLLKFFGKEDISVAKGASQPLLRSGIDASDIHGKTGMEGYEFEEPNFSKLSEDSAIDAMRKVLLESEESITIVPLGPLTNIAMLIRVYPEVRDKIKEIILMGGSVNRGNCGVMSEFNFHVDPEAAQIVIRSGIPIVMTPLDVGLKALVYPEDSEKIKNMNKTGEMIYSLFKKYRGGSFLTGLKMYDSCAIGYLMNPQMFTAVSVFVDVETKGEFTSGCSVIDLKGYLKKEPNVKVCVDIDESMFKKWFLQSIEKCV